MSSQTSPTVFWSNDTYEVRSVCANDEFHAEWWAFMRELHWNRSFYDLDTWTHSRSSRFIILVDKRSNKPVGHIGAIINDNSTGWVSAFVIAKQHRGEGLGRPLFQAALDDLARAGTRTVGLDAVVEQRGTYERRGFVASELGTVKIIERPLSVEIPATPTVESGVVLDLRRVPQGLLAEHELKYTGFERSQLWSDQVIFNRPDVQGFAYGTQDELKSVDDLHSWIVIRRCSSGARIGPLYARDVSSARIVLLAAMNAVTPAWIKQTPLPDEALSDWSEEKITNEASFSTEVWSGNPEAVKLFEECGWQDTGVKYFRMWVDGKATTQQSENGMAQKGAFAYFDAGTG